VALGAEENCSTDFSIGKLSFKNTIFWAGNPHFERNLTAKLKFSAAIISSVENCRLIVVKLFLRGVMGSVAR